MKKITILLFLCVLSFSSCKKDDNIVASVIDCAFEWDLFFHLSESVPDATNPLNVEFTVTYTGTEALNHTVKWNFGDNSSETSGTTVTHEYATPGDYTVKANLTIDQTGKDNFCYHTITKTITVN